jgi:hypothetical protein
MEEQKMVKLLTVLWLRPNLYLKHISGKAVPLAQSISFLLLHVGNMIGGYLI